MQPLASPAVAFELTGHAARRMLERRVSMHHVSTVLAGAYLVRSRRPGRAVEWTAAVVRDQKRAWLSVVLDHRVAGVRVITVYWRERRASQACAGAMPRREARSGARVLPPQVAA